MEDDQTGEYLDGTRAEGDDQGKGFLSSQHLNTVLPRFSMSNQLILKHMKLNLIHSYHRPQNLWQTDGRTLQVTYRALG